MKKKIYLTVIGLLALTVTAKAQITITAPPASAANYLDTFAVPNNPNDFKAYATAKTNGKWDFTLAQYPNIQFITLRSTNTSANFPDADYRHSVKYEFAGGLKYDLYEYYNLTSDAITTIGEEIEQEQVLLLDAVTGNPNDKLVFPIQDIPYSEPQIVRKYPETMGSTFTSTRVSTTKLNVTISAYGLNSTPGVRRTYRTAKDSVIGWGTLKTTGISTKAIYDNIPVLQVQHIVTVVDSFYLGGGPAPKALLDAFGLQQGVPQNFYFIDFIGQGELGELVRLDFKTSPFQTVDKVEIQQNRIEQYATGINKLSLQNAINVYPNPITNNKVLVDLPTNHANNNWTFNLTDIFGRSIAAGVISNSGEINMPASMAKGNYILTISNSNGVVSINKLLK